MASAISGDSAELGEFDPTILKNGVYEICLSAQDASGNSAEDMVSVILDGGLELGQVNFSAEDISMPQPGFPVSLVRTYDSRSTGDGDFGPGRNPICIKLRTEFGPMDYINNHIREICFSMALVFNIRYKKTFSDISDRVLNLKAERRFLSMARIAGQIKKVWMKYLMTSD